MYNQTIAAEFTDWSAEFTGVASSTAPPVGTGINYWELHPALSYVYLVGLLLQMVLGNAGNALVIGSVAVDKRLRKESNILILNLALADLCVTGKCTYTHNIHTQTRTYAHHHRPAPGDLCVTGKCTYTHNIHAQTRTHIIITLPLAISASRVSAHTRTTYTHKHARTSSSPCPWRSLRHG